MVPTRAKGIFERGSNEVPRPTNGQNTSGAERNLVNEPEETHNKAHRRRERALVEPLEVINVDESPPGTSFSPGKYGMPKI